MTDNAIKGIKPELLWKRFYEISQVPRPSKKEGKVLDYLRKTAKELNLDYKEDSTGNIVISKPATAGYEKAPAVVLQSHVDMVCEKNKGTQHDFDNDPLKLKREGDWIKAEGTTLGADNGIGAAAALAVLSDNDIVHGPIECLFTVDEETGLTGVNNLQPGFVKGKILLNMDSEEDGAFYVGCAGGQDTMGIFEIKYAKPSSSFAAYELMVSGLKGGHSGMEIQTGKANAIKILARTLQKLEPLNYEVASVTGGSKRNAIPREAETLILLNPKDESKAKEIIAAFNAEALNEYKNVDGGLKITLEKKSASPDKVFDKNFTSGLIKALIALPHGVLAMSQDIPGLVETSTNLATITHEDNLLKVGTSQRSSIESAKYNAAQMVVSVFELVGAKVTQGDGYPGWKPNMNSAILKTSENVYKKLFNGNPEVKAIHAGLECGIIGDKYPGMDMISFGPTIEGAHSPDERVNIPTVEKFYALLKGILLELAGSKK